MSHAIAADDIVATLADAGDRPPLIVLDRLVSFLDAHGLGDGEPSFAMIGDGHSNVTYAVRRGGRRFVLRRPPRPPIPPSANDMLREARVLTALAGRARVPRVLAVSHDESVLGAPFYVMEELRGIVAGTDIPAALDTPGERRRMGEELVDALVELHALDWRAAGLEGFGRPDGYLDRQLRRFRGLWEANRTREIPAVDRVADWLGRHVPRSPASTIVHGDYRLGNVMFDAAAPARIVAVLDWEMSTIGDPLADLGYLCALYADRDDPPSPVFDFAALTRRDGFPLKRELIARYEDGSGRSMTDIRWYRTLAVWKVAVYMEGNFRRACTGMSDDPYLRSFGDQVVELARQAEELSRRG
ncbi:MAG: phosphotransferase family protein [Solirubrobacteraceae bacterium]